MGGLLTAASALAAFFAGMVALFSPCCIVFLFPAYLASAVKNRRWKLFPLTLIFGLGIAMVLLPITLGVGLLSSTLARYHTPLYAAGGVLLLALAVLSFSGHTWSMPSFIKAPSIQRSDTAGVFALGIFSGIASSCCAPVMAGVLALSAVSPSLVGSASLGLAYVFGMVFPLFLMALLWDRFHLGERRLFQAKPVKVRLRARTIDTNTLNIAVAVAFAAMGVFVLFLALNGNTTVAPGFQAAIGRGLSRVFSRILSFLDPVPDPILGLGLLAFAAGFVVLGLRSRSPQPQGGSNHEHEDAGEEGELEAAPHCHPSPERAGDPSELDETSEAPAAR